MAYINTLCTMPRDKMGTRSLAHLLAAQIRPHNPKQAKEPIFPPATKDELVTWT